MWPKTAQNSEVKGGRIVITGSGVVSAIGCGKTASLEALCARRSGIGPVKHLKGGPEGLLVGEVPLSNKEMAALAGVPMELAEVWPRTTLMSILALQEALFEAGISWRETPSSASLRDPVRANAPEGVSLQEIPVIGGTTVGGMDVTERIYPTVSHLHSCGASTDLAVGFLGGSKFATTLSTACSSATNAIIYGANLIRSGKYQCVVCGGSESLSAYHFHGFNSLMILDKEPCRPFDATRAGLNLGEGAAYLVMETEESALRRGAKPIAVLSGWGNACDAFHQTASSPNGEGAFLAMKKALAMAWLEPSAIDYINAHGTGTPNNDASESAAIRRIFGESLPPVSSTKSFTGHTTSASGSIKAVFCMLALQHGFLLPQLNWSTPDPACIIPETEPVQRELRHILTNAFGFGGNDSSLILSAYDA
ncbi:MAG: beta-ketoacyl-[Bacteroidales bacterium]|nr:beta-ketoacyl-[acyl-carrier-protein] synthase family protein [Bacteroidales bacterium]